MFNQSIRCQKSLWLFHPLKIGLRKNLFSSGQSAICMHITSRVDYILGYLIGEKFIYFLKFELRNADRSNCAKCTLNGLHFQVSHTSLSQRNLHRYISILVFPLIYHRWPPSCFIAFLLYYPLSLTVLIWHLVVVLFEIIWNSSFNLIFNLILILWFSVLFPFWTLNSRPFMMKRN